MNTDKMQLNYKKMQNNLFEFAFIRVHPCSSVAKMYLPGLVAPRHFEMGFASEVF